MPRPISSSQALAAFHPAVSEWFSARFGRPTEAQEQAWHITSTHQHALIAAPTGSGKTLAAFLAAINDLVVEGLAHGLKDEVHILYVSPLKALSNDIQKNLQEPLAGIRDKLLEQGLPDVAIRDAVRTGDTSTVERERMRRTPPHILVTTPESLFILLTSESGRAMLSRVRSVIVDELHAVAGNKRGAHLMLTLERLEALCSRPPVRIGLSATQKPIEEMARFLVGDRSPLTPPPSPPAVPPSPREAGRGTVVGGLSPPVRIVDTGHVRKRDLALELPKAPLEAVMANEVWGEIYDRLAELIGGHRTTLIFVSQRRLAERATRHLAERIGAEHVTAHHGSLSKEHRLQAEQRLKSGQLKALVATSSLELGIDIGDIDLVCQLGSTRSIAAFLQRVGRAGHAVGAVPKGRLFPLSLDELADAAALLDSVQRGELDRIRIPTRPLDVLAQQIVAEVACREWDVDALHQLLRRAHPYRELTREDYEQVLKMLAEGFSTRRGRRSAYLHYDAINGKLRARKGAKLTAVTNAGVIPDQFDYDVVLSPEGQRIGSIGEDFSFESIPGDIFQLGNNSYRILKVEVGKVHVEDAKGQPPTLPFWFGEAPARTEELSASVSRLREKVMTLLEDPVPSPLRGEGQGGGETPPGTPHPNLPPQGGKETRCERWLQTDIGLPPAGAQQLTQYLAAAKNALGTLPTLDTIVLERFFDEAGDTHLVIHSPYGSRLNRAWGLALRKRFCRSFNFELQASALEDTIVLSLGPTHSFPLDDIKHYLKSASVREILIQALLDAPMFGTRWRWDASIALALKRMRNGKRIAPQLQRMDSEDLLTVVFPDQLACAENLTGGDREIPDHPLVRQVIDDCLHETMDIDGLEALLKRIEAGEVKFVTRELTSPSPLAHAILSAKPYAFLDDGDAEERRTRAVKTRQLLDPQSAADLGHIDAAAIARVREEAWPEVATADELHDALTVSGFLTAQEVRKLTPTLALPPQGGGDSAPSPLRGEGWDGGVAAMLDVLVHDRRVARLAPQGGSELWVAAERRPQFELALQGDEEALREIIRNRLELLGPVTEAQLAAPLGIGLPSIQIALAALEAEGAVMRGNFTGSNNELGPRLRGDDDFVVEWCERRLLHRMHRYTRDRQRSEIQPVPPAQFMRFLFRWHGLPSATALTPPMAPPSVPPSPRWAGRGTSDAAFSREADPRREGEAGLLGVLSQLEGCTAPAAAWEEDVLPLRMKHYSPQMLDRLCATGRVAWCRPVLRQGSGQAARGNAEAARKSGPVRMTPIFWSGRENLAHWQRPAEGEAPALSSRAQRVLDSLKAHGASFLDELVHDGGLLFTEAELAIGELVSHGLVTADSFAGLRGLLMTSARRSRLRGRGLGVEEAGRWALTRRPRAAPASQAALAEPHVEHIARVLLRRYGVVFRKLLERESELPPWRELFYVYRRLEARGEIRGGRFVSGFAGEQFALADATTMLRKLSRDESEDLVAISAADPLNLVGVILPGERVPALSGNRLLLRNGVPVAVQAGREVRYLQALDSHAEWEIRNLLIRKQRHASYFDMPRSPQ
jgi:ATP-dependent Lhr-like helicase